jgi:hypothetical protein
MRAQKWPQLSDALWANGMAGRALSAMASGTTFHPMNRRRAAMLTFNQLLRAGGLDPAKVRIMRHKPKPDVHRAVFDAAMRADDAFRECE